MRREPHSRPDKDSTRVLSRGRHSRRGQPRSLSVQAHRTGQVCAGPRESDPPARPSERQANMRASCGSSVSPTPRRGCDRHVPLTPRRPHTLSRACRRRPKNAGVGRPDPDGSAHATRLLTGVSAGQEPLRARWWQVKDPNLRSFRDGLQTEGSNWLTCAKASGPRTSSRIPHKHSTPLDHFQRRPDGDPVVPLTRLAQACDTGETTRRPPAHADRGSQGARDAVRSGNRTSTGSRRVGCCR